MNISRIINLFFKNKDIFSEIKSIHINEIKELFEPTIRALVCNAEKWKNIPEIIDALKSIERIDSKSLKLENTEKSYQILRNFLQFRNNKDLIINFIDILLHNLEILILSIPLIDKDIYKSLTQLINSIQSNYSLEIKDLITDFGKNFFSVINVVTIMQSILFFQEKRDFEEIEIKMDKDEYEKYISDWTLKYAQILEGPLKRALFFLLKLDYIKREEDYTHLDIRELSLGRLSNKLQFYTVLTNYRNAINHQNIFLESSKSFEIQNKRIILYDRKKKFVLNLNEFINEFYKVIIFLFSFYLVVLKSYLKFYHQPEQIINKILINCREGLELISSNSFHVFILLLQSQPNKL